MQWLQESFSALAANDGPTDGADGAGGSSKSTKLQSEGQLSREQLLHFFQSASEIMQAEEFRRKLKDAKLLKQDIEDKITDMQMKVFEKQGIEGKHGIAFLGQVNTVYKTDNGIMSELLKFASLEEDTLDEVEMSGAEYEQKQRLMALAKAHTAQLMNKMDSLPPEERQAFLQSQLKVAEQIRSNMAAGNPQAGNPNPKRKPVAPQQQPGFNSMSPQEMMLFLRQQRSSS